MPVHRAIYETLESRLLVQMEPHFPPLCRRAQVGDSRAGEIGHADRLRGRTRLDGDRAGEGGLLPGVEDVGLAQGVNALGGNRQFGFQQTDGIAAAQLVFDGGGVLHGLTGSHQIIAHLRFKG